MNAEKASSLHAKTSTQDLKIKNRKILLVIHEI
jgi:hypothetical protein